MRSEKYWVKALDQTHLSITNNGLFPLKTTVVTRESVSYTHLTLPTKRIV